MFEFVLLLVLPFISIPFFLLSRDKKHRDMIYLLFLFLVLVLSFAVLLETISGSTVNLSFLSLDFELNKVNSFYGFLTSIVAFSVAFYSVSHKYAEHINYDVFFMLALASIQCTIYSGNLLSVLLFLDLSIFSAGYLIRFGDNALSAAFTFVFSNIIGSLFFMGGLMFFISITGSTSFDSVPEGPSAVYALVLLFIGFAIKMGVFPFHMWVVPSYTKSTIPVASILSAQSLVSVFAFYKVHSAFMTNHSLIPFMVVFLGLATMVYTGIVVMKEKGWRKVISYISIFDNGFILLGIAFMSTAGALYLIFAQTLAKSLAFLAGAFVENKNAVKVVPVAAFAFIVAVFSLVGVPPTGGFAGKFLILTTIYPWSVPAMLLLFLVFVASIREIDNYVFSGKRTKVKGYRASFLSMLLLSALIILLGLFYPQVLEVIN